MARSKETMKRPNHQKTRPLAVALMIMALLTFLPAGQPVFAQEEQPEWLLMPSTPQTGQFPQIDFYLEAYDETNAAIPDLTLDEVSVLENGVAVPLDSLKRVEPGVQMIVATNNAPYLANVVGGLAFFDRIRLALRDWAARQPADTPDDFSIASNTGLVAVRLQEPQQWVKAIEDFIPNLRDSQPSVISISQALDLATDPSENPRMKRAILYITTVPTAAEQEALPNLAERAAQLGVRVYVWLVAAPGVINSPEVQPLQQMAAVTGGQLFLYTGKEDLPDLDAYLTPIRYEYQARYTSRILQGGTQRFAVQTQRTGVVSTSEEQQFELNVQPPNPIFLSPPVNIQRTWTEPEDRQEEAELLPQTAAISILIEFPDGHPREVRSTQLYVNNVLAVENMQPPFDVFIWPLDEYVESERVMLQVRMEDSLGLQGESIETAVQIAVQPRDTGFVDRLLTRRWPIILAVVLLAAGILLSVLYFARRRQAVRSRREERRAYRDPLTQPVPIRQVEPPQPRAPVESEEPARDKISWAFSKLKAPARLVRLDADGNTIRGGSIALDKDEITFGKDRKRVAAVIDSPSVSGLHARFFRAADGNYMLADAGSVAGTWINYVPASLEGVSLQHGDLVHFGKVAYRFELNNPPKQNRLKVVPYEEDHDTD